MSDVVGIRVRPGDESCAALNLESQVVVQTEVYWSDKVLARLWEQDDGAVIDRGLHGRCILRPVVTLGSEVKNVASRKGGS